MASPIFDADNHLYETRDALTSIPEVAEGGPSILVRMEYCSCAVEISDYIPNPTVSAVPRRPQEQYSQEGNPQIAAADHSGPRGSIHRPPERWPGSRSRHEQGVETTR